MLENSQLSAYRNLHSLPPLLPPHQPRVTVLGEEQPGADGTGNSARCLPTRWQCSPACPCRTLGRPGEPGWACQGQPAAHPWGIIGLPLSIFTQQTEILARQPLQKGYRTQHSWIQAWILGSIDSLSFIISQTTLSYTYCNRTYSKAFPFCSFHCFDI